MKVYNVQFDNRSTHECFCQVFSSNKLAEEWIDEQCWKKKLKKYSSMEEFPPIVLDEEYNEVEQPGFVPSWYDWRCEDEQGNTIYFVVYTQELV